MMQLREVTLTPTLTLTLTLTRRPGRVRRPAVLLLPGLDRHRAQVG